EMTYKEMTYKEMTYKEMTKRISLLLALSIALGIHTPCYGLYVMVRSGFGELKADDVGKFEKKNGEMTWFEDGDVFNPPVLHLGTDGASILSRNTDCTSGQFKYKDHKNLSVALGGRIDVFDIGALGLEVEILGAYTPSKRTTKLSTIDTYIVETPDLILMRDRTLNIAAEEISRNMTFMWLKNQRIAGAQFNIYWEHYLLDYLSVGIGGGIGGAYVCTKFTTREYYQYLEWEDGIPQGQYYWGHAGEFIQRRKYVHTGSLLYNFTLFVRAEKFETLFEVGYRHIGLHQMFGAKCYGYEIPKLANMHSDQIYLGVGRTF
ncbi:MAG: hypothetical protein MJ218_02040, partial [Opitutales bacterium]|nr:hypothetical protein [Opitutales bacterium]